MDKIIGRGLWREALIELDKAVIIADSKVVEIYKNDFDLLGKKHQIISILATEENKSRNTKHEIEDMLFENNADRDTLLVAIGGGIITDLTGFIAATFKRGIRYVNIPTTLLAMADASIGGKTGVNTKHGKNMIGSIWHPAKVIIDIDFLETLPDDEFMCGMAEIIKIAATCDIEFFRFIEKHKDEIKRREEKILIEMLERSVELKLGIVKSDENDKWRRHILNFGHTIGHALEKTMDYKLKHGECVSIGVIAESKISYNLGLIKSDEIKRIINLMEIFGLPIVMPKVDESTFFKHISADKKSGNGLINIVLLENIGKVKHENGSFSFSIDKNIIKEVMGSLG